MKKPTPSTLEEFVAEPSGRYVAGRSFLYWCVDPSFYCLVVWGCPGDRDATELIPALAAQRRAGIAQKSLVDVSRLERVDRAAYQALADHYTAHMEALSAVRSATAFVRSSNLEGAAATGFFDTLNAPFPVRAFPTATEALAWLERPKETLVELESLLAETASTTETVRALRAVVLESLAETTLPRAARSLGLSQRTLQRRLSEAGTSFQLELNRAQVRAAQTLLRDGDAKLSAVALEVGCSSLQHFSGLFRRLTGESPSAWRARNR